MQENLITKEMLDPSLRLNDREKRFCELVAEGHSGAEAVRLAGYSPYAPKRYAQELRKRKKISDEILRLVAEREGYTKIDDQRLVKEFMTIVNADIADYINEDGAIMDPKTIKSLPPHKTKPIQSIKQTVTKTGVTTEIKLYDKQVALDKLARHANFYRAEESEKTPVVNLVLPGALLNISGGS